MQLIDKWIGEIMDEMGKLGIDDNRIVVAMGTMAILPNTHHKAASHQ